MEIAPTAPDRFTACRGSFMPVCPPDRQKRPQEPPHDTGVQEYHPHRKSRPAGRTGRAAGRPAQDSRSGQASPGQPQRVQLHRGAAGHGKAPAQPSSLAGVWYGLGIQGQPVVISSTGSFCPSALSGSSSAAPSGSSATP